MSNPSAPRAPGLSTNAVGTIIIIVGGVLLYLMLWACDEMSGAGSGSESPDGYSSCAELATYPGTDYATARCVENGVVIDYKDSPYGKNIGRIVGQ